MAASIHSLAFRSGLTLIELMVVILIVVILMAIILPAIVMVQRSVHRGGAQSLVIAIHNAIEIYCGEDARKRMPPIEMDDTLSTRLIRADALGALDRLRLCGLEWRMDQIDGVSGALLDPWRRPLRCPIDVNMDGSPDRPAPRDDWNARGDEPYAYIHSLGVPRDGADGLPAAAERWIYVRTTP